MWYGIFHGVKQCHVQSGVHVLWHLQACVLLTEFMYYARKLSGSVNSL